MSRQGLLPAARPTDPDVYWEQYWETRKRRLRHWEEKARLAPLTEFEQWWLRYYSPSYLRREDRPVTETEKFWLRWCIEDLRQPDPYHGGHWIDADTEKLEAFELPYTPDPFLAQIDGLRVVATRECDFPDCKWGCLDLYFQGDVERQTQMLWIASIPGKRSVYVYLNVVTLRIAHLEIGP